MKTKLLTFAVLALLTSSAFAATPTYIWRLYSPGIKGIATAPADPLLPTASSVFTTWNPSDMGTYMVLSTDNLTAAGNGGGWASVRATQALSSGKWYWESTITGGYTTNNGYLIGAGNSTFDLNALIGNMNYSGNSVGWTSTNIYYYLNWPGATVPVGAAPAGGADPVSTTFMVAMDMDAHAIYMGVNGTWNGGGVPTSGAAKTGAVLTGFTGTVFPAISSFQTQSTSNFGATPFKYSVPAGYHAGVFQ